jgi:hypothetical protein
VRELHESHTPSVYESQHSLPSSRAFGGRGGGGGGSVHAQMLTRALPMTAVALSGFRRTSSQPRGISWSPGRSNTGSGAETPALPLLSWWALWVRPPKACASARRSAATKECNFMRVNNRRSCPNSYMKHLTHACGKFILCLTYPGFERKELCSFQKSISQQTVVFHSDAAERVGRDLRSLNAVCACGALMCCCASRGCIRQPRTGPSETSNERRTARRQHRKAQTPRLAPSR